MLCMLHVVHRPETPTSESTTALLMQGKLKLLHEAATTSKDSSWFVKCVVAMRSICDQNALRPESTACARAPTTPRTSFCNSRVLSVYPTDAYPQRGSFSQWVTSKCGMFHVLPVRHIPFSMTGSPATVPSLTICILQLHSAVVS